MKSITKISIILFLIGIYFVSGDDKINNENTKFNIQNNQSVECDLCVIGTLFIDDLIKVGNVTLNDIEVFTELLCQLIGGNFIHKECNFIIDFIQSIYNLLNTGLTPLQTCVELHICNSNFTHN